MRQVAGCVQSRLAAQVGLASVAIGLNAGSASHPAGEAPRSVLLVRGAPLAGRMSRVLQLAQEKLAVFAGVHGGG